MIELHLLYPIKLAGNQFRDSVTTAADSAGDWERLDFLSKLRRLRRFPTPDRKFPLTLRLELYFNRPMKNVIKKCSNHVEGDWISYLPDEILVSVISRLDNVAEQARTSILARRWAKLWRYSTSLRIVLANDIPQAGKLYSPSRCKEFVPRVNLILELLLATSIEDFTVIFRLKDKRFQHDIDGWVKLALQKQVKRLKLHFSFAWAISNFYSLTTETICNHHTGSLTSVSLHHVDVTGDFLEYLLLVSPALEELCVYYSYTLVDFTVTGQSLKLKHLEISFCSKLRHLHIYDVNLVSFKYSGRSSYVAIKDTPCLVKAELYPFLVHNDPGSTVLLVSRLPLLQTLKVVPSLGLRTTWLPKCPTLRHLTHLELVMRPNKTCCLLCAHLLEASPLLIELKVEFQFFKDNSDEEMVQRVEHQNTGLKVVKFSGFIGCRLDVAIALYVIEKAAALEKVIVDTNHPYTTTTEIDPNKQDSARTLAREKLLVKDVYWSSMVDIKASQ